MRLHVLLILLCLFLVAVLGACVSAEEQRAAEATTIAASIFATQTAEAPTVTPTYTPSPVPTDTPVPTPTDTPTPTPTPTQTAEPSPTSPPESASVPKPTAIPIELPEGWVDYAGDGFHIALPGDWQVINVDEVGFDAIMDALDQFDADWADNIRALTSSEAMRESTRLFAMSTEMAGLSFANVIVQQQALPIPLDSHALARQFEAVYEQLGIGVEEAEAGLEINGLDALRIAVAVPVGPLTMEQIQYIIVDRRELWVLGMTVDQQAAGDLRAVFAEIAGTFRTGQ